jgi:hypothetical protein
MFSATWMTDLNIVIGQWPANTIPMPGTHDAASYGISESSPWAPDSSALQAAIETFFSGSLIMAAAKRWSRAQSSTILQQLNGGIRHLDIRVAYTNGKFLTYHGLYSVPLQTVFDDVKTFLGQSNVSKELIIIGLNHFNGYPWPDNGADLVYTMLSNTLQQWLITPGSPNDPLNTLLAGGKQVIAIFEQSPTTGGAWWQQSSIWEPWADGRTGNLESLQAYLGEVLAQRSSTQFFNLKAAVTPGPGMIAKGFVPGFTHSLEGLAEDVNPHVRDWIASNWDHSVNIVDVDWYEYSTLLDVMLTIIGLRTVWSTQLAPAVGADGKLQVLAVASNGSNTVAQGAVYLRCWQNEADGWHLGGPLPTAITLGTVLSHVTSAICYGGHLEVFALDYDGNALLPCWQEGNTWKPSGALPAPPSGVTAHQYSALTVAMGNTMNNSGASAPALQVIGLGSDDYQPYLVAWQTLQGSYSAANASDYALSNPSGKSYASLAAGAGWTSLTGSQAPALQLVALGTDGNVYLPCWQDQFGAWHSGTSSPFANPAPCSQLILATGYDHGNQVLQAIGLGTNGVAYLVQWQDEGGTWLATNPFAKGSQSLQPVLTRTFAMLAAGRHFDNLLIVGYGTDQNVYLIAWQDSTGIWHQGDDRFTSAYALPVPTGLPQLTQIFVAPGNGGRAQVIGLDKNGLAQLVCWLDDVAHSGGFLP